MLLNCNEPLQNWPPLSGSDLSVTPCKDDVGSNSTAVKPKCLSFRFLELTASDRFGLTVELLAQTLESQIRNLAQKEGCPGERHIERLPSLRALCEVPHRWRQWEGG